MSKELNFAELQKLHQKGELIKAKQGYLKLLTVSPEDAEVLHALALLLVEENNFEEAEHYFETLIHLNPDEPIYQMHLANVYKAKGLYKRAEKTLLNVTAHHPSFGGAFNNLGTVYYAQAKLTQAVAAYRQALEVQPNYIDAYYNLGLALGKLNQYDQSITTYQALLDLAPEHVGALFHLGCLYMIKEDFNAALSAFSKIEKSHPHHFETQVNLATVYLKLSDLTQAKAHYMKAHAIRDQDEQVLFNLGVIALQESQLAIALDYFLQVIKANPQHFDAQHNIAFIYLTRRQPDLALKYFHAALRLQPENKAIQHTIAILKGDPHVQNSPPDYIKSLFDSYADHFDQHLKKSLHYQVPELLYEAARDLLRNRSQLEMVDIGAGTGLTGAIFKPHAKRLLGIDLSEKMLAQAAYKKIYDQLFATDIIPFLAAHPNEFDVITAGDVIVYFGDLQPLLQSVRNSLKINGIFVFNVEMGKEKPYTLTAAGRFTHDPDYISALAQAEQLTIAVAKKAVLRMQDNRPVYGMLYVLQKER